jgi:glycerol-3-phosphate dehydrogenase
VEDHGQAVFREVPVVDLPGLSVTQQRRLRGRHGLALPQMTALLEEIGNQPVGSLDTLWVELAQACDNELVLHLDDLLLRRTRIGLLLANGAAAEMPLIRSLCQPRLGWSDARWDEEQLRYLALWHNAYSLPPATAKELNRD